MTTPRFRPTIVISFTILISSLFSSISFANAVVNSEFELKLPRGFQQRIIDKTWGTLQRERFQTSLPIPDQKVSASEVEVLLSGIRLDFQTQLQKPAVPAPGPSLVLESRNMSAQLQMDSLSVDQWIVKEIDGVIGRFHLQAQCQNLRLELKPGAGSFTMRLSPQIQGPRILSHLDDMTIAWSEDAWVLQPITCTGAVGFEDVITSHIQNMIKNSSALTERKAELMTYVQSYLDTKYVDLSKPKIISSGRPDILYSMQVQSLQSDAQTLSARGLLTLQFRNVKNRAPVTLRLSKSETGISDTRSAQLQIPQALLETMIERAYMPNTWKARVSSAQVPGFESLMKSTLIKCLLWPELKHFDENSRFAFDLNTRVPVRLEGRAKSNSYEYNVAGVLDVKMLAPKSVNGQERLVPFMNFQIPLESEVNLTLANGSLSAVFTNVQVSLQPTWEASYVETYRPNQNFYGEELRRKFLKEAEGARLQYRLPAIQLFSDVRLQVQSLSSRSTRDDLILLLN